MLGLVQGLQFRRPLAGILNPLRLRVLAGLIRLLFAAVFTHTVDKTVCFKYRFDRFSHSPVSSRINGVINFTVIVNQVCAAIIALCVISPFVTSTVSIVGNSRLFQMRICIPLVIPCFFRTRIDDCITGMLALIDRAINHIRAKILAAYLAMQSFAIAVHQTLVRTRRL